MQACSTAASLGCLPFSSWLLLLACLFAHAEKQGVTLSPEQMPSEIVAQKPTRVGPKVFKEAQTHLRGELAPLNSSKGCPAISALWLWAGTRPTSLCVQGFPCASPGLVPAPSHKGRAIRESLNKREGKPSISLTIFKCDQSCISEGCRKIKISPFYLFVHTHPLPLQREEMAAEAARKQQTTLPM